MRTIITLFEQNVEKYAQNPFLWEKKDKKYESTSYKEVYESVTQFAAGLLSLGIEKGERCALLSEGRNDWVISELAILFTGAVNVPLSIKLTPPEIEFRLNHSETRTLIISRSMSSKLTDIRRNLPLLKNIIYLDDKDLRTENEFSKSDIYKLGTEFLQQNPQKLSERKKGIFENDYANISYTSGTTADPKGIILTHRNYTANVEQALSLIKIPPTFRTLAILPLDHCFAHVVAIYSFMASGASLGTIQTGSTPMQTLKNIPENIKELKPDVLLSVPALAKNFKKNIETAIAAKGPKAEKLFNFAMKLSYAYNREGYNKKSYKIFCRVILWFFDKILFSKIRENFGGNLKFFVGGGALLDLDLQKFFYAIGIPMLQGYGLSEATPVISSNSLKKHKLGSSGFLVTPIELKILDEDGKELPVGEKGEIVVCGENVMAGYWKNEKSTAETIKSGWLHTGDSGYMDSDGFLYVLGRFKSLLISGDGEKYSPESIEEAFSEQGKFIDQSILHNNQNPYTIGLIVPKKEALKSELQKAGLNLASRLTHEHALELIQREINSYKKGGRFENQFPERWLPVSFTILNQGFSEENKMMNSTLKIVRPKVTEFYQDVINYLYTTEGKNFINNRNIEAVKKLLTE
jgi:long-chain acyl-CoA synthetase